MGCRSVAKAAAHFGGCGVRGQVEELETRSLPSRPPEVCELPGLLAGLPSPCAPSLGAGAGNPTPSHQPGGSDGPGSRWSPITVRWRGGRSAPARRGSQLALLAPGASDAHPDTATRGAQGGRGRSAPAVCAPRRAPAPAPGRPREEQAARRGPAPAGGRAPGAGAGESRGARPAM
ncbi:hypothetical protein AB1E18_012909 [Capra hircus]